MVGNPLGVSQDGGLLARALEASELEREGRLQLSGKFLYVRGAVGGSEWDTLGPWCGTSLGSHWKLRLASYERAALDLH